MQHNRRKAPADVRHHRPNGQEREELRGEQVEYPTSGAFQAELAVDFGLESERRASGLILVVPPDDVHAAGLVPLERQQQQQNFQSVPASVHDVPIKQVLVLRGWGAVLEKQPQHIFQLTVRVADDDEPPPRRHHEPHDVGRPAPERVRRAEGSADRVRRKYFPGVRPGVEAMKGPGGVRLPARFRGRLAPEDLGVPRQEVPGATGLQEEAVQGPTAGQRGGLWACHCHRREASPAELLTDLVLLHRLHIRGIIAQGAHLIPEAQGRRGTIPTQAATLEPHLAISCLHDATSHALDWLLPKRLQRLPKIRPICCRGHRCRELTRPPRRAKLLPDELPSVSPRQKCGIRHRRRQWAAERLRKRAPLRQSRRRQAQGSVAAKARQLQPRPAAGQRVLRPELLRRVHPEARLHGHGARASTPLEQAIS
mmetsp:Transcript_162875/g.522219  ORF Transcript_162875/g.522219 Transcript_162875/m.522219 type:complete len:425 (-) Transcript_162875:59-1333(-)